MSLFAKEYFKGKFQPRHPEKCLNFNGKIPNAKIPEIRSSWEKIMCNWCDLNTNILEWGSEIIEIPYYSEIDQKQHRYITDFCFIQINRNGEKEKWLVEVKPSTQIPQLNECGQIIYPELDKKRLTQKRIDTWKEKCEVLKRNHEKWTYARQWCKEHGYKFKVVSENELAINY